MNNLIFLRKFDLINPTMDDKNDFMISEITDELECGDIGKIYTNDVLFEHDLDKFIPEEVAKHHPLWVIAVGNSATIAQRLKRQRKILVNPKVEFDDLNNISEFDRSYTYGFFDKNHEEDYKHFQSVYPNSAWYCTSNSIYLFTIKDIVRDIITEEKEEPRKVAR